jgi:primosomal protein N' (replication factor Y)
MCHYCGHTEAPPRECPKCHSHHLRTQGSGTERLELELKRAFPAIAIARLDRDVAQRPADLHHALHEFRTGRTQILVGTQMVTKGHDFPNVTLVGVVFADAGLNFPDFRAAERTAQQLVQVAGRSGRAGKAGRVLVQTYHPTHAAILAAQTHDYLTFARGELEERKAMGWPPFARLLLLRCDGEDLAAVRERLSSAADKLRAQPIEVLGPAPCPLERLQGRFRMMLLLRHQEAHALRAAVRAASIVTGEEGKTKLVLDCDPVTML